MKIKQHSILLIFFSLLFTFKTYAQSNTIKGYRIQGEEVTFIFKVDDYPNIKNNGNPIDNVFVSGEFNNWAKDEWPMVKVNDSTYELKKSL